VSLHPTHKTDAHPYLHFVCADISMARYRPCLPFLSAFALQINCCRSGGGVAFCCLNFASKSVWNLYSLPVIPTFMYFYSTRLGSAASCDSWLQRRFSFFGHFRHLLIFFQTTVCHMLGIQLLPIRRAVAVLMRLLSHACRLCLLRPRWDKCTWTVGSAASELSVSSFS